MQYEMTTIEVVPSVTLAEAWLKDQAIAFAATLLGTYDPSSGPRTLACARYLETSLADMPVELLSDSTLSLLATIGTEYYEYFSMDKLARRKQAQYVDGPILLEPLARKAQAELANRDTVAASGLNRVLISHAVYLLRRPHLSALKILKWLNRAAPNAVPGIRTILADLQSPGSTRGLHVTNLLDSSRNTNTQTRDRLDELGSFHALLLDAAGDQRREAETWLTRICMAYRSSLFCWPLLTEGTEEENGKTAEDATDGEAQQRAVRGLSLPISLFVLEDGKSSWQPAPNARGQQIWFGYHLTRAEERAGKRRPRFEPTTYAGPPHITGFRFCFAQDWWDALRIGADVAKKLWASQNGRLKFADADAADRKLRASLNVDLRAACDIVEVVFSALPDDAWTKMPLDKHFFMVGGRSAEAYWVQCVLSLLLPGEDVPMGVCTGKIDYRDGEFEMGNVAGIAAKLEYANRAGFPRVVVAGDSREYFGELYLDEDEQVEEGGDGPDVSPETAAAPKPGDLDEADPIRAELRAFLDRLDEDRSKKTVEVNFARTARAAADAMQSAGWRRTDFLRTPEFQRKFGRTHKRLYMRDALRDRQQARRLKRLDIEEYRRSPWRDYEEGRLRALDRLLTSRTGRTVVHVTRAEVRNAYPALSVEEALGKWAAWKDNRVRTGEGIGYRDPGLGVATLRSADGDTETRLWAALAEMLDADEHWWEQFQWADLPDAADLLGQLLCNQRADPKIGLGAAPDLVIVFDDAGFATRRTNLVFPTEFHHQFIDLLNPRHPSNHKRDYLDEALKRHDRSGRDIGARIVVVLAEDQQTELEPADVDLMPEDRALLERLSIFRFGCSRHAAYAMANFDIEPAARLQWKQFEQSVQRLIGDRLLSASRADLFLTSKGRRAVGQPQIYEDAQRLVSAHRHAALALCPILFPQGARMSTNRDRQLEPASVLDAIWHLQTAFRLVPWRFRHSWLTNGGLPRVADAQAQLTFLRTAPDWDTVTRLRVNQRTRQDSVDLCLELLSAQTKILGREPPSMVVGLTIETCGRLYKNVPQGQATIDAKVDEITAIVDKAIANLHAEDLTKSEWQRRMRHLLSRQIFALRMLGLSLADPRMAGARNYIDNAVTEIVKPDFLEELGDGREGLDDFPIARDCWRTLWSDGKDDATPNKSLSPFERSRYAYAAARSNLSRSRPVSGPTEPWDEPWIEYFILTRPDIVSPEQIRAPLKTWWQIYGQTAEDSLAFGRRVLDKDEHAARTKKGEWEERWFSDLAAAWGNLWRYITHEDQATRLVGAPVAPALRLIGVLALQETLPAFQFMKDSGPFWLKHWHRLALSEPTRGWPAAAEGAFGFVADEWAALGRAVVGNKVGWIAMLADLKTLKDDSVRLSRVMHWLHAYEAMGIDRLHDADPEALTLKARRMPLAAEYLRTANHARSNARAILDLHTDGKPWLEEQRFRVLLSDIVASLSNN